jgi:hypothetical protein
MAGLRHKASHKIGNGYLHGMLVALESFAIRTTEFSGRLRLQVHPAEKIGEARV